MHLKRRDAAAGEERFPARFKCTEKGSKMDREREKAVLEAILFTMGESVETDRLASVIERDGQ